MGGVQLSMKTSHVLCTACLVLLGHWRGIDNRNFVRCWKFDKISLKRDLKVLLQFLWCWLGNHTLFWYWSSCYYCSCYFKFIYYYYVVIGFLWKPKQFVIVMQEEVKRVLFMFHVLPFLKRFVWRQGSWVVISSSLCMFHKTVPTLPKMWPNLYRLKIILLNHVIRVSIAFIPQPVAYFVQTFPALSVWVLRII